MSLFDFSCEKIDGFFLFLIPGSVGLFFFADVLILCRKLFYLMIFLPSDSGVERGITSIYPILADS